MLSLCGVETKGSKTQRLYAMTHAQAENLSQESRKQHMPMTSKRTASQRTDPDDSHSSQTKKPRIQDKKAQGAQEAREAQEARVRYEVLFAEDGNANGSLFYVRPGVRHQMECDGKRIIFELRRPDDNPDGNPDGNLDPREWRLYVTVDSSQPDEALLSQETIEAERKEYARVHRELTTALDNATSELRQALGEVDAADVTTDDTIKFLVNKLSLITKRLDQHKALQALRCEVIKSARTYVCRRGTQYSLDDDRFSVLFYKKVTRKPTDTKETHIQFDVPVSEGPPVLV